MTESSAPYNAGQPPGPKEASVELYSQEGDTPRTIWVYLNHQGDLEIGSQDFPSEALRGFVGGAGEYEYFSTVQADAKDRLLLALLAEKYRGNPRAVEDFRYWCQARGIPCAFDTWGHDYC